MQQPSDGPSTQVEEQKNGETNFDFLNEYIHQAQSPNKNVSQQNAAEADANKEQIKQNQPR